MRRSAGPFRTTERNIGGPACKIAMELRMPLDDAQLWRERQVYDPDELTLRLHRRLVAIHRFPNSNGRHARLHADLLIAGLGGSRFS